MQVVIVILVITVYIVQEAHVMLKGEKNVLMELIVLRSPTTVVKMRTDKPDVDREEMSDKRP